MWATLVRKYAELQIESLHLTGELRDAGFEILDLHRMAEDAVALMSDRHFLTGAGRLTEDESDWLFVIGEKWLRSLRDLADSDAPLVLEHGDLDTHQVIIDGETLRILDWADSLLTVPFVGLENFIRTLHEGRGGPRPTSHFPGRAWQRPKCARLDAGEWSERWTRRAMN